jgi:hypothetical protein
MLVNFTPSEVNQRRDFEGLWPHASALSERVSY